MTKLYIMNVSPLCEEGMFRRSLTIISEARREKALRLKARSDAALSIGAELLLRYALMRDFMIKKLPAICQANRGKPYFDIPVYFSLSHSGEYAACLVSDERDVGVDIQLVRSFDMRAAKRALSEKAYAELEAAGESVRDARFAELWVLHESAVKLHGGTVFDKVNCDCAWLVGAPPGYKLAVAVGDRR